MYIIYLTLAILFLLEEFLRLNSSIFINPLIPESGFVFLYLLAAIGYLYNYRKKNLFCFETMFLVFNFLIIFFDYLVLSSAPETSLIGSLSGQYGDNIKVKTLYVSMLATLFFILGCYVSDRRSIHNVQHNESLVLSNKLDKVSIKYLSKALIALTVSYFVYLIAVGDVITWFIYSKDSIDYSNTRIVYLTVLCLSSTIAQFAQYTGRTFSSIWKFIIQIDKWYLCVIGAIAILLLISGNRNEALYVILPVIASYSIFINRITNRDFLVIFFVGLFVMVFIGLTRSTGVGKDLSVMASINLLDFTQDFGYANIDSMYLIETTDKNGTMGFETGLITLFSSIPFLGGFMVKLFNLNEFARSAMATTDGMNITFMGLGTSLVGDTYYTGGIIFTLTFFYFLGRLMSYLYSVLYIEKKINIYALVIYLFMFSNAIYCLRSEWYTSFRYIGFSAVVLFICSKFISPKI